MPPATARDSRFTGFHANTCMTFRSTSGGSARAAARRRCRWDGPQETERRGEAARSILLRTVVASAPDIHHGRRGVDPVASSARRGTLRRRAPPVRTPPARRWTSRVANREARSRRSHRAAGAIHVTWKQALRALSWRTASASRSKVCRGGHFLCRQRFQYVNQRGLLTKHRPPMAANAKRRRWRPRIPPGLAWLWRRNRLPCRCG